MRGITVSTITENLRDIESDLSAGAERLKSHLHILGGPKGYQVTILILILHPQRGVIPARTAEANLLPYLVHELAVFRGSRDLDNEDIVLKMDLDFHRRWVTVIQRYALKHLRSRLPKP